MIRMICMLLSTHTNHYHGCKLIHVALSSTVNSKQPTKIFNSWCYCFKTMIKTVLCFVLCSLCLTQDIVSIEENYVTQNDSKSDLKWDENGYVFFCLCMGRMGNKMDHFLGGLAFAKLLNRTLVLPPFHTYKNIPFEEWFKVEPLKAYHKVITANDFMEYLAPLHWPKGKRVGFCWMPANSPQKCDLKGGSPFGPFWDGLGIDFDETIQFNIVFGNPEQWNTQYPSSKYPVLAFRGAPAAYPVIPKNRALQQYLHFTDLITNEAEQFIHKHLNGKTFVGIHLRNGQDWENSCKHIDGTRSYMSSPQCTDGPATEEMCLPSKATILQHLRKIVMKTKAKAVFIATDRYPLIEDIEKHLEEFKIKAFHLDPYLAMVDQAILIKADHFIGNCVSSFTAYVKRARDIEQLDSTFWAFDE